MVVSIKDLQASLSNARNHRYDSAKRNLNKLVKILVKKYNVSKIILIGSLHDTRRFGFHSDIDLCVEGLSDEEYFSAVGEILLAADEFDVDIIRSEDITSEIKRHIQRGTILYEK